MTKITSILFLFFCLIPCKVLLALDCTTQTEIPAIECDSLNALYNSTNGDDWTDKTGWDSNTPCSAYGITCQHGHVARIELINNLTGTIPSEIQNFTQLWHLDLGNANSADYGVWNHLNLENGIPNEILHMTQLSRLSLAHTGLRSIPPEIGNLVHLTSLDLSYNNITGSIPAAIFNMTSLSTLELQSNQLTGTIPAEIGNMNNLLFLWLYGNQLSGPIPPELGNLTNLRWLVLNYNQLTGNIPSELGNLTQLELFLLSGNQLTGTIPLGVAQICASIDPTLGSCLLSGNDESLCIPDTPSYQNLNKDPIGGLSLSENCEEIATTNLPAGATAVLQPSSATELQSFGILEPLVIGTPFNADHDTFIIVHGWNPDDNLTSIPADSWERDMGSDLMDKTGVGGGNVLLWDWMDKARNDHYGTNIVQKIRGVPYSWVPASGENLAIAMKNYLPPDYEGKVHMIGHSLGSGVIIYAAKWFKKYQRENVKQLTLLDSPWIGHYPAGKFLKDNKDTLFVDNYNTMFGRPQGYRYADVNVFIRMNPINDENELLHVSFAHQFAHAWYRSSITNFQDKTILGDSTVPHEQMPYGFYWHSHQNGIAHRWLGDSPDPSWKVEVIPAEKIYGRVVSAGHNLQEFAGQTRNNLMQFAHETGTNVKILKANAMNRLSDLASYVTDQVGHAQWIEEASGNGQLMLILNSEAVVTRQMNIPAESNSFQFNYEFPSGTDPQTRLEVFFGDNMVFSVKATDVSIGVTQQSPWIDISALAGQQTDLSFRLSNPVDGPLGKIKLDDLIFAKLTVASAKFPWPMFLPAVTGGR